MSGREFIFILLVWFVKDNYSRKINDDLVYQHDAAVRQRMSEVRQFLVPLPDDQWDQLLRHLGTLLVPVNAASDMCRNHSLHLLQSFLDQEIWALRMIDASSKLQSGVLDGHMHNLGNYAQCISVEEPNRMFRGQHCVIETTGMLPPEISDIIYRMGYPYVGDDGMLSLCVPSSCSDLDINTHVDRSLAALGVKSKYFVDDLALSTDIRQISCFTAEGLPFRMKDYFAISVFASLVLLVLLASIIGSKSGWLSCFSLSKNFQELMDTRVGPDEITCLSGLRVLLVLQVIAAHRLFAVLFMPSSRLSTVYKIFETIAMSILELIMPRSVDVFFLLGGIVLSYNFLVKTRRRQDFNYLSYIFRRYFRVTPVLTLVVLFHSTLLIHSAHGPLWLRYVAPYEDRCHLYWWRSLLHISNLLPPYATCVVEGWYINCDFQLQCFAPVVLLLLLRRPGLGLAIAFLCFLLSIVAWTITAFHLQLSSGDWVSFLLWDRMTEMVHPQVYKSTIFRAQTFFIGLVLGYLIFYCKQTKGPTFLSKGTAWLGWTLAAATMSGLMYLNFELVSPDHQFMPLLDPLFVGLSRTVYCACFAWLIFACHFGYGGHVNKFLSWAGFRPLGKLVFTVYLIHVELQMLQMGSAETTPIFSYVDQIFLYQGDVMASFIVAAVVYTTVELPFFKLANLMITGFERRTKKRN